MYNGVANLQSQVLMAHNSQIEYPLVKYITNLLTLDMP